MLIRFPYLPTGKKSIDHHITKIPKEGEEQKGFIFTKSHFKAYSDHFKTANIERESNMVREWLLYVVGWDVGN